MAKIAIISEFPDAATWGLAQGLHDQRQDVLLITSRDAEIDQVPSFPLMTPFRKWSPLEAVKIFPRILQFNPDVIHFVFSQEKSVVRWAHWMLAPALSAVPNKALAMSSFSELNMRRPGEASFLKFFNLMTFGTRTHLMKMKRAMRSTRPVLSEVMPPFEVHRTQTADSAPRIREDLETLLRKLGKFIVMPASPTNPEIVDIFQRAGFETLVMSEKFKFNTPYFTTGALSPHERTHVLKSAQAIFIAGLELSVAELKELQVLSQTSLKPLMVQPSQIEDLPGLCWHGRSGWVLDQGLASLQNVLRSHPNLEISGNFESISPGENLDSTLNELLRLYAKALQQKRDVI